MLIDVHFTKEELNSGASCVASTMTMYSYSVDERTMVVYPLDVQDIKPPASSVGDVPIYSSSG